MRSRDWLTNQGLVAATRHRATSRIRVSSSKEQVGETLRRFRIRYGQPRPMDWMDEESYVP